MQLLAKSSSAPAQFICQVDCVYAVFMLELSGGISQKRSWQIQKTLPSAC